MVAPPPPIVAALAASNLLTYFAAEVELFRGLSEETNIIFFLEEVGLLVDWY